MENSGNVFFADDRAEWYLAAGENHRGPFKAADIYQKILAHEITWAHYIWKTGESRWQRICEAEIFRPAVPQPPQRLPVAADPSKKSPTGQQTGSRDLITRGLQKPPGPDDRTWFLYYNQTQYGPFSRDEINRLILIGRVHGRVHAWRNGLPNWQRLEKLVDFTEVLQAAADLPEVHTPLRTQTIELPHGSRGLEGTGTGTGRPKKSQSGEPSINLMKDKRSSLRAPLVAKILMADEKGVTVGLCRDISIGGMQVLTDKLPGTVGARIRLNVSAIGDEHVQGRAPRGAGPTGKIEPFVAEGVVVRILEDNRGFSFRFDKLAGSAKRAIEQYIDSTQ